MASSGVRRLRSARTAKRTSLSSKDKARVSRKIRFLVSEEGLGQNQAVGKAFGIIRQEKKKRRSGA